MTATRTLASALAGGLALTACPAGSAEPPAPRPKPPHSQPASAPASRPVLLLVGPSDDPFTLEQRAYRIVHRGPHDLVIAESSKRWGHDPFVLDGLLTRESGKQTGVHHKRTKARGISQFVPSGAAAVGRLQRKRGLRDVFTYAKALDPREAIPAAAELLAYLMDVCGGLHEALVAYNRGSCGRPNAFSRSVLRIANALRVAAALPPIRLESRFAVSRGGES